ncbi:glycosyltransferase [uncultured Psychroserpens sp.]|uniref:glycosyltransferase n=1 Tax=uncultured Psychroserpens sp. TaxID=255436 RepID=UPI00261F1D99|nr:glycosyltransferase [uncultured Psychroserpens sp.]
MEIKPGVTIALCTYNGIKLLEQTLKYIAAQELSIPCELILVDNASTDGTKHFADQWWEINGSKAISYKSLEQAIPGKSYAQDMAYEHAVYEYILVCDDDNWLNPNYVQLSYDIMQSNLSIGALGGSSEAAFESNPPEWFDRFAFYYAVGEQSEVNGDVTQSLGYLYGAGMVIRKSHWLELKAVGFEHILSCRKGNALSSGGDTEYCYALQLLGYKIWYDDRLLFKHYMTKNRLNLNYLSRLRSAMAYSNFVIHTYRCVLKGIRPDQNKLLRSKLKKNFFKHSYKRIFGNYNEKEIAKNYFRQIKLIIVSHRERIKHYDFITSWARNRK